MKKNAKNALLYEHLGCILRTSSRQVYMTFVKSVGQLNRSWDSCIHQI